MKRIISAFLCLFFVTGTQFVGATAKEQAAQLALHLVAAVPNPTVASVGGEWTILSLARMNARVPDGYFDIYLNNAQQILKEKNGVLHARKYTEYARVVLALTALSKDAQSFAGFDLVSPLLDYEAVIRQGINGPVFALLALDCAPYEPDNYQIRRQYIDYILTCQKPDGGFSLGGQESDPDITGMVLCALSEYRSQPEVTEAIERALLCLSVMQNENGGYESYSTQNVESIVWVIMALCALDIPLTDARFVKQASTLDALMTYKRDGGFAHKSDEENADLMATEQVAYALCSVVRKENGQNKFYDMKNELTATPVCLIRRSDAPKINMKSFFDKLIAER